MSDRLRAALGAEAEQIPELTPDLGTIEHRGRHRRRMRYAATSVLGVVLLAAVAVPLGSLLGLGSNGQPQAHPVLSPAPRQDCFMGFLNGPPISVNDYAALMRGQLPTWMPEGFGLLDTFGGIEAGQAKFPTTGIWVDDRCREVTMHASVGTAHELAGPRVGIWTVSESAPDACGNMVLGSGRCLTYATTLNGMNYALQMMGVERDEGDRIALSVPLREGLPTLLVSSLGPSGDDALLQGTLFVRGGCLAVGEPGQSSVYVMWPHGYTLSQRGDRIWILGTDGTPLVYVGQRIQMGGGITNLANAEPVVLGGIPASCHASGPDAYWFAAVPEPSKA